MNKESWFLYDYDFIFTPDLRPIFTGGGVTCLRFKDARGLAIVLGGLFPKPFPTIFVHNR